MKSFGYPVGFDASHSIQKPGGLGTESGGAKEFIPILTKAAIAAGCNLIFIESHPNPEQAKSDKACVMAFDKLKELLPQMEKLHKLINDF